MNDLTWPGDTTEIEMIAIVDFKVLFDYRPLSFAGPVDRREKVFRVDFVVNPLVTGEAYAGQQQRHDHEVAGVSADDEAQFVKRTVQEVIDALEVLPHLRKVKATRVLSYYYSTRRVPGISNLL